MAAENNRSFNIQLCLTVQMQIGYLFTVPHSPLLLWSPFLRYLFQKEEVRRPDKMWVLSMIK